MLNNLGAYAFHDGRWTDAVVLYRRAGNLCARAGDWATRRSRDCNVGEVLVMQGRLTAADEALRRALRVWRGTGDDSGVAFANALLGRAAVHQGRSDAGRGLLQSAFAKSKQLGHQAEASARRRSWPRRWCSAVTPTARCRSSRRSGSGCSTSGWSRCSTGCGDARWRSSASRARRATRSGARSHARASWRSSTTSRPASHALDALDVATGGAEPARRRERDALLERLGVVPAAGAADPAAPRSA